MSQRVLATQTAEQAAQQMRSLLSGDLKSRIAAVRQQGQTLATPSVWDGPAAERFRTQWPPVVRSMDQAVQALANLERSSEAAIDNIITAGTEGTIGAPGTPGGPGAPGFGDAMWRAVENYFLPPTALGGAAVGLWATRRTLTAFGATQTWLTTVRWGEFAPLDEAGNPIALDSLSRWQLAWNLRADGNWIAKAGFSAETRTAWETAGRWGGRASGVLAIGAAALGQWIQDSGDKRLDTDARVGRSAYAGLVTGGATWAGTVAGTEIGSAIGSAIFPGVGTAVGGIIGGIAGAIVGSGVGGYVVSHTVDAVGHAADAVGHTLGHLGGGALHTLASLNPF